LEWQSETFDQETRMKPDDENRPQPVASSSKATRPDTRTGDTRTGDTRTGRRGSSQPLRGLLGALLLAGAWGCAVPLEVGAKPAAPPAALAAFTVQDLLGLRRISEPETSPDGRRLTFTMRTDDLRANKGHTSIWLLETAKRGAEPRDLTPDDSHDGGAVWSRDGQYIYFLSARSGSTQVWRMTAAGGNPVQVTNLPLDVGTFRVAPNGDRLLVSLDVFRDCEDLACTKQRLEAAAKSAASGVLYDHLFARHWDAWSDGRRSQLFSIALGAGGQAEGMPVNLTSGIDGDVPGKPFGGREDYAFSPDGRQVVFSVRIAGLSEPWSTNFDLYVVAATGGRARNLTADNPAADTAPAFSPDGATLAYLAADRPGFESDRMHLVLLDWAQGSKRALTDHWDRSIEAFAWSRDGKTLFATTDHLGQRPLWAIDAATGRSAAITGEGTVEAFAVGPQAVFYAASNLAHPNDLYSVGFGGGKTQQLTKINQALLGGRRLGEFEQFSFAGWNAETVFGYVVKPADFKPGQKYPIAYVVHGGPQGSLANLWHWRWNAQTLAGAGYGVVLVDFHGSTGYGQAFTDSISRDWGGKPLEDLQAGLAAALKQYPWLDGERACALGGSYGGYMMNWIAGKWPDRFECLVSHDGIFDNRSMYYSTEELWFPEWEMGGPEYQNPAGYAQFNPMDYVANWRTPTLVIHGQLDYRVPYSQGLAVFTALQRRGVPSELLFYPDENHWVLRPADRVQWYDTVIAWMNRWTKP
jgi:dipeptidyl aminopeptidase/acylaminoacyl peptidase